MDLNGIVPIKDANINLIRDVIEAPFDGFRVRMVLRKGPRKNKFHLV
jgi:hypothetical protein